MGQPQIITSDQEWLLGLARTQTQEMLDKFSTSLQNGEVQLPQVVTPPTVNAGGVNYCPDSDIKFSAFALANVGVTPETGDSAYEAARFYRQVVGANVVKDSAHALKATGHSLFAANEDANHDIPIWDRANGQAIFGAAGGTQWDIAVNLYANHVAAANRWYVKVVLGAMTADIVPADLEMYAGLWVKTAGGQGWATGSQLVLSHVPVGIAGSKHLNYVVVATNDVGAVLYSQVLGVTDAPNGFDTANDIPGNSVSYPRVSYSGAGGAGFIQFKIYREDVTAGTFWQIADIRDANSFVFDDQGAKVNMGTPLSALPTGGSDKPIAKAITSRLVVGVYGGILQINDYTIQIPSGYDISQTLAGEQYLRFGFTEATAVARQVRIDKIYFGPTFNDYSDCIFDPVGAIASSQPTSGTPTGGGPDLPPNPGDGGGGDPGCPNVTNYALVVDGKGVRAVLVGNLKQGMIVQDATKRRAEIEHIEFVDDGMMLRVECEDGFASECSMTEPFIRNIDDRDGKKASWLAVGLDTILCYDLDTREAKEKFVTRVQAIGAGRVARITLSDGSESLYLSGVSKRKMLCRHNNVAKQINQ